MVWGMFWGTGDGFGDADSVHRRGLNESLETGLTTIFMTNLRYILED